MKLIKKFEKFLLESKADEIVDLASDDSYSLDLISSYCNDVDPSVDLKSAVSLLDEKTQDDILSLIKKYKSNRKEEDPEVIANTDLNLLEESESTLAGRNLFNCFLKIFTALGYKNIQPNWKQTPNEFLIYYVTEEIEYLEIRSVTSRFKYLDQTIEKISTSTKTARLYFGLTTNLTIEYGIIYQDNANKIGEFKFIKSTYNSLLISDYLALMNFKSIQQKQ